MKAAHLCSSWTPSGNIWSSVGWSICAQLPPADGAAEDWLGGSGDSVGSGVATPLVVTFPPSDEAHVVAPPEGRVAVMHSHPSISTNPPLPCNGTGGSW